MKSLQDTYNKNVGHISLFSEILDIDFYDGPTEAVCQLADSDQWFICSLVYIDMERGERIFTMLEISNESWLHFKSLLERIPSDQANFYRQIKTQVRAVYNNYSGKAFLFKSDWLNGSEYKIVEMPLKQLHYFGDIEEVLGQSEESKLKWKECFLVAE